MYNVGGMFVKFIKFLKLKLLLKNESRKGLFDNNKKQRE